MSVCTMGTMDHTGDTRVQWDSTDDTEVEIARAAFIKARQGGKLAYKIEDDGENVQLHQFDPEAREILFVPQHVGG